MQRRADWPHPGMAVPSFQGVTLAGDTVVVGSTDGQVILFFDTRCGNCVVTLPAWKRLAGAAREERFEVVGVSVDPEAETRPYAAEHGLSFPVLTLSDPAMVELYRISGVPVSLVIGPAGRVRAVHAVHRGSMFEDSHEVDSLISAARVARRGGGKEQSSRIVPGSVP